MTPEIEVLLQASGQTVVEVIGVPFTRAWAYVEMLVDTGSTSIYYETPDEQIWSVRLDKEAANALFDAFNKLWRAWKAENGEPWSAMTFGIDEDGAFGVDLSYEDVSDVGAYGDRRALWKTERFGSRKVTVRF